MLNTFPNNLVRYSETSVFNEDTVPEGLQRNHKTKPGVWAKAVVTRGSIDYILEDTPEDVLRVDAGNFALIEPEVPHHVRVTGEVTFQLEFYRAQNT
ncbi:DUF1971 domain-containing protein [Kiloniella sp.]|uniref:DUF1971 domain-containing protein n=1 Tax=Kiloniella sp. TaxID=1938587 RepID=UPI003B023CCE